MGGAEVLVEQAQAIGPASKTGPILLLAGSHRLNVEKRLVSKEIYRPTGIEAALLVKRKATEGLCLASWLHGRRPRLPGGKEVRDNVVI